MTGPDLFYLLCKLIGDPRVPKLQKAKLLGAVAYFISPIDLLPEAILGPIGYLDDIAFAAYALHSVINSIEPGVAQEHWTGKEDVLATIQKILGSANRMLGSGLWGRLIKKFGRGKA